MLKKHGKKQGPAEGPQSPALVTAMLYNVHFRLKR